MPFVIILPVLAYKLGYRAGRRSVQRFAASRCSSRFLLVP